MVGVTIEYTFGTRTPRAIEMATGIMARIAKRIHEQECPNGHPNPPGVLTGSIIIYPDSEEGYSIVSRGMCCDEYYQRLRAI